MVYQGPSRGCNSCKRRRKKCDGARPSCMRCLNAHRACGGYEDTSSTFRRYEARGSDHPSAFESTARKCSLPKRVPVPGTNILPTENLPTEVTEAESDQLALRAFFYDYCIVPTNQNLSRGFLSGLEKMAHRLGPTSDLAKACQAVGFGSHGKPLHRPKLVDKAERIYHELLGSLARAIDSPALVNVTEARLVAQLLGLYQIIMTSETDHGNHEAHAKGLSALMKTGHSPLNLLGTLRPGSSKNFPVAGIFSVPALSGQSESLDSLLLALDRVSTKCETHSRVDDFNVLWNECTDLDRRFAQFQNSRTTEFQPTASGNIVWNEAASDIAVGYWPGRVDTYFDLYVAGVWNILRGARLLLLALIMDLSDRLGKADTCVDHMYIANCVVKDMVASIPYHLAENLQNFLNDPARGTIDPGRSLGGLLLMHPLYIVTQMPFLPEKMHAYMRRCLVWIESNMGLGQAALLAEAPNMDINYLASGCMVIWAGFLG